MPLVKSLVWKLQFISFMNKSWKAWIQLELLIETKITFTVEGKESYKFTAKNHIADTYIL